MKDLLNISGQLLLALILMWLSSLTSVNFSGIVLPISLQSMMAILIPLIFRSNVGVAAIGLYLVLGALGVLVCSALECRLALLPSNKCCIHLHVRGEL